MTNKLVEVKIENLDGALYVSSRDVAEGLEKQHKNVMRDLDKIVESDSEYFRHEIMTSTYINSRGKEYREYLLTKSGISNYLLNCRSLNSDNLKRMIEKYDLDMNYKIVPTRFELSFEKVLKEMSNVFGYKFIPQYRVKNYRIDFYFKKENIAVEYDENYHKYKNKKDKKRQLDIEKELGCEFIRLNSDKSDVVNASNVIKKLLNN